MAGGALSRAGLGHTVGHGGTHDVVRTDHLRTLGWSAEAITNLPQRVEQGDFTLFDLVELAQQVKEAGIAPWGLYHHPTGG